MFFFGRVYGSLAVSRSFGDAKYKRPKTSKDFVSWEPYTEILTLESHHKYMILACDGLFDVMNYQEVADMTHKLFQEGHDPAFVAKALVVRAVKDLQTEDNVTVIVVKIDWVDADGVPIQNSTCEHTPQQTSPAPVETEEQSSKQESTPTPPLSEAEQPTPVQTPPQEDDVHTESCPTTSLPQE